MSASGWNEPNAGLMAVSIFTVPGATDVVSKMWSVDYVRHVGHSGGETGVIGAGNGLGVNDALACALC